MRDPAHSPADGKLQARPDLEYVTAGPADAPDAGVVVKDPVTLAYFRFGARERFLLEQLREPVTVEALRRRLGGRFPDEPASADEVLQFCAALGESSLLLRCGDVKPPSGARTAAALLNPLAIRLPAFDPTPLLIAAGGFGRIVFRSSVAVALLLVAIAVGVALLGRAEEVLAGLERLADLADPRYALAALAALAVVKAWHELGHALACRRFGGECHEMGVLLLAFFPCLYCDVSDAWTFPDRKRRAVVALAGVYFEAILAVAAAAAWLVLAPGLTQTLALYVVVAASLSTVLVNLNPLVRFDGYYLLSDCWGVANLGQQSHRALWGRLSDWIAGRRPRAEAFDAPRWALAAYAAVAAVYKTILLAVILWGVHGWLAANELRPLADAVVAVALGGLVVATAMTASRLLRQPLPAARLMAAARLATVIAVAAGGVWGALGWSVEQSLKSPCRIESERAVTIATAAAGELLAEVGYGDRVARGQVIAIVRDAATELRRLELEEQVAANAARLAGLRRRASADAELFAEIAESETRVAELRRQLRTHDSVSLRRTVRAPVAGTLVPPPERGETPAAVELGAWTGAPLDRANRGCSVAAGDELGVIVGERLAAVVLLDQHDSGLVEVGDPVRVALDRDPGAPLAGRVEAIALAASDDAGARPTGASDVLVERALRGPLDSGRSYRVAVSLEARAENPHDRSVAQHGAVGQARVVTGRETLLGWCLRWARRTLRLPV